MRMILHPEAATNEIDHPGARPEVRGISERRGSLEEHLGERRPVVSGEFRWAARGGHACKPIGALLAVCPEPPMDRPTIDTQALGDLAGPKVFLEKGDGFQTPSLEGLGISEGSHVSPPKKSMRH
jgi:hypothetical protein